MSGSYDFSRVCCYNRYANLPYRGLNAFPFILVNITKAFRRILNVSHILLTTFVRLLIPGH